MNNLWDLTLALVHGVWRKTSAWQRSARLTDLRAPLSLHENAVKEISAVLKRRNHSDVRQTEQSEDMETVEQIRKETAVWNLNNVTRTQAYWNLYCRFPELHWSLLAHMVSRNGGWSMTDLKGEWLPKMMDDRLEEEHFEMLEACNALIFRDAYPQLMLYAQSRKRQMSLFHLLQPLGVSSFMRPVWERFWQTKESVILTVALIINEQHVIERPVVKNDRFRRRVFETRLFRALPLLQTNQIVFPLLPVSGSGGLVPLAGRILENFESLDERIGFGKSLYAMLFGYPRVLAGVEAFASKVPHTGSRADYWPQRFTVSKRKTGRTPDEREVTAGGGWYSPPLESAWADRPLPASPPRDWFKDSSVLSWLNAPVRPRIIDITDEHLHGLRKLQAAAVLTDGL